MIVNGIRLAELLHQSINREAGAVSAVATFEKNNSQHRLRIEDGKFFNPSDEFYKVIEIKKIEALEEINLQKITVEKEILF